MSTRQWLVLAPFIALALAVLSGCRAQEDLAQFIPPAGKYDVRILRDNWGVPHIFGKRDIDTAYGLAYAHCEDDWLNIEDSCLITRGQLASVRGKTWAKFDYIAHLFRVNEFVEQKYKTDLSPEVRAIAEAYAEGITHFAAVNRDRMAHIKLPVTGKEIVAGAALKAPFFYDLQTYLLEILQEEHPLGVRRDGVAVSSNPMENPFTRGQEIGSNAWAVGPKRSADGATRLAINSHMPWEGPLTWYEAHCHSEEGWNVIGATFPGGPMIFKGHDENKGWCHTINRPDLADIYKLEINPGNPDQYKFDGQWRDLEKGIARINVKLLGPISWTFKRELLWSIHGPAIRTPRGVFALRFIGYGEIRQLEQWYRMNKAQSLDQFLAAMRLHALTSLNTLYADKAGNLYYAYGAQFPKRDPGFDWTKPLEGNTSKNLWTGIYGFDMNPQVLNPPSGFLFTCNNTPFRSTDGEGNPGKDEFPPEIGIENRMTNRALRALELYGADPSITREEFFAYKYDKHYSKDSAIAHYLQRLFESELPQGDIYQQALNLLKSWDFSTDKDNKTAALALMAAESYLDWAKFEEAGTPPDVVTPFKNAVDTLLKTHGRLDIPWQEILRLRRGATDIGLGGGPDCLRAVDLKRTEDGRYVGVNGDCYFLMVEWDKDGRLTSQGVHQYGAASTDPQSPHYADQAPLFAEERLRPTLLSEQDIRANLAREYRPGEFHDPWY